MGVDPCPVAEPCEEPPDLRLEYDNQGQHADIEHHIHYSGGEPHPEHGHDEPDHVQGNDGNENIPRRRSPQPTEKEKDNQRNQQNVQNVQQGQSQESEQSQNHCDTL